MAPWVDGWDEDDSGRTVGMDDRENENILAKIGNFCLSKMVGICEKNTIHCIMAASRLRGKLGKMSGLRS